ncbi:hypothetical protein [Mangrovimonas sp. TPBH4]|nr:hypothetical protein [Mangrovimonas sp. TPBH4]
MITLYSCSIASPYQPYSNLMETYGVFWGEFATKNLDEIKINVIN